MVHGDKNTQFFHTSTIIRKRRNRIEMLKNNEGQWITDGQELEQLAIQYFTRLYSLEDIDQVVERLPYAGFEKLSREEKVELSKPFTGVEVERAIKSMGKFKAPGPDGFQPIFYQNLGMLLGSR